MLLPLSKNYSKQFLRSKNFPCFHIYQPQLLLQKNFSASMRFKSSTVSCTHLQKYYNKMLEDPVLNEDGFIEFDPRHLNNMVSLIKDKADINFILKAFYNMKGHKTDFQCSDLDELILRAIEVKSTLDIFDLYNYHNFLGYYPAPYVVNKTLENLIYTKDSESLEEF